METAGVIAGLVLIGVALVAGQLKPGLQAAKQRSQRRGPARR